MSDTVLDLSFGDTSGFDPIPSGKYNIKVHKVELAETGPNSKKPGTPMIKLQHKVVDGDYADRIVFDQFVLPSRDTENAEKTIGFFIRFLMALGYDEGDVKSRGFDLSKLEDLENKEAVASVVFVPEGQYPAKNEVRSYKPAGSGTGDAGKPELL